MKSIKDLRESYNLITEKEEHDMNKLTQLIRAGLFDAKKLSALKRAMDKPADKMTAQEKRMMINLLDALMAEVLSDKQVYRKIKQDVMMKEAKDYYSGSDPRVKRFGYPSQKEAPSVLLLKRKAIRVFPDGQKVALYYAQSIDKYVSIPYNEIGINEEVELDEFVGPAIRAAVTVGKTAISKGKKVYDAYKAKKAADVAAQAKNLEQAKKLATSRKKALSDKAAKPGSKKAKETRATTVSNKLKQAKQRSRPGFLKRLGRGAARLASAVGGAGGDGGSSGGSEPKSFTPMSSKIQANITAPKREGGSDARAERERQANLRATRSMAQNESVDLDGNMFELNNKAAQKVKSLYESLNKKNKKKMIDMMSESKESFNKVISFAVRQ